MEKRESDKKGFRNIEKLSFSSRLSKNGRNGFGRDGLFVCFRAE